MKTREERDRGWEMYQGLPHEAQVEFFVRLWASLEVRAEGGDDTAVLVLGEIGDFIAKIQMRSAAAS